MPPTPHRHLIEGKCRCGERDCLPARSAEEGIVRGVETALLHGLFPEPVLRLALLRSVGAATLLPALSSILPIEALKALAQEKKPLEKTKLNVGFLPIPCDAPVIYGEQLGTDRTG